MSYKVLNLLRSYNNFLDICFFLLCLTVFTSIIGNAALNINIILFDVLIIFYFFREKIYQKIKKKYLLIFLIINIFLLLNIYNSEYFYLPIKAYLGLIKNFIFFVGCLLLFLNNKNYLNSLSRVIFFGIALVLFDTLYQYLNDGVDIFGFKTLGHGGRLSGPFGDEYIVGAYLAKYLFFSLFFMNNHIINKNLDLIWISFVIIVIFLTKERASSLISLMAFFLYIISKKQKYRLTFIFIPILLIILIFNFNINLKNHFIDRTLVQFGWDKKLENSRKDQSSFEMGHDNFFDSQWGAHFLTANEIFKDNYILGSGLNTFRIECGKKTYANIKSKNSEGRCATHPHNIYLQILSDTGLAGFILILFFIFLYIFKFIFIYVKNYQISSPIIIAMFFLFFSPLQTTGSILTTWNSYFYWLMISVTTFHLVCFSKNKNFSL